METENLQDCSIERQPWKPRLALRKAPPRGFGGGERVFERGAGEEPRVASLLGGRRASCRFATRQEKSLVSLRYSAGEEPRVASLLGGRRRASCRFATRRQEKSLVSLRYSAGEEPRVASLLGRRRASCRFATRQEKSLVSLRYSAGEEPRVASLLGRRRASCRFATRQEKSLVSLRYSAGEEPRVASLLGTRQEKSLVSLRYSARESYLCWEEGDGCRWFALLVGHDPRAFAWPMRRALASGLRRPHVKKKGQSNYGNRKP